MNILVSAAGRRVGLLECLRRGLRDLNLQGWIVAADASLSAPAAHLADSFRRTPRCDSDAFLPAIERLCERETIGLLVPTIDTELPVYAAARDSLARIGVHVAVSSPETIAIATDKRHTNRWFTEHGFPGVRQAPLTSAPPDLSPPWIVKPARGSASDGVRRVDNYEQLAALGELGPDWVIEELAPGVEHTIHVYVDADGRCLAAVPCRRLEVRAGEVSKGLTVRHAGLIDVARSIAEALPGARGPLNIQGFLDDAGALRLTEINARFGGGYPLVDRAGAPFARWLIEEALGRTPQPASEDWQDDLAMLRYDDAVYLPGRMLRDAEAAERSVSAGT